MSFIVKVKTEIKDVELFKQAAQELGLKWIQSVRVDDTAATLSLDGSLSARQCAYLKHDQARNIHYLHADNDLNYSEFARKFGKNGGILMQRYAQLAVQRQISARGGMLLSQTTREDGSIVLKYSVR